MSNSLEEQKVLLIGELAQNNDKFLKLIALKNNTVNQGLVNNIDQKIEDPGIYHTSFADISLIEIENLIDKFDLILILDLPKEQYAQVEFFHSARVLYLYLKNWNVKPVKLINGKTFKI